MSTVSQEANQALSNLIIIPQFNGIEHLTVAEAAMAMRLGSSKTLYGYIKESDYWKLACFKKGNEITVVPHLVMEAHRALRDATEWNK